MIGDMWEKSGPVDCPGSERVFGELGDREKEKPFFPEVSIVSLFFSGFFLVALNKWLGLINSTSERPEEGSVWIVLEGG